MLEEDLGPHRRMCVLLRLAEKRILLSAIECATQKIKIWKKKKVWLHIVVVCCCCCCNLSFSKCLHFEKSSPPVLCRSHLIICPADFTKFSKRFINQKVRKKIKWLREEERRVLHNWLSPYGNNLTLVLYYYQSSIFSGENRNSSFRDRFFDFIRLDFTANYYSTDWWRCIYSSCSRFSSFSFFFWLPSGEESVQLPNSFI